MATHVISRADPAYAAPPAATAARDDDIDIPTLVSTLNDNKWAILIGTLAFFVIATVYVLLATPKYEANAVVQVEARPPTVPGLSNHENTPAPPIGDAPAATETQLLTSRRVLGEAIELWLSALIVGVIVAAVGGYLVRQGLQRLKEVSPMPDQTVQTLKEDAQWLKNQAR